MGEVLLWWFLFLLFLCCCFILYFDCFRLVLFSTLDNFIYFLTLLLSFFVADTSAFFVITDFPFCWFLCFLVLGFYAVVNMFCFCLSCFFLNCDFFSLLIITLFSILIFVSCLFYFILFYFIFHHSFLYSNWLIRYYYFAVWLF